MTLDGSYKKLKDLTLSDHLILPILNKTDESYPKLKLDNVTDSKTKLISEGVLIERFSEFCRFFGFMLGDGWLDKSNKTVCFSIGDRTDKSDKYVEFIKSIDCSYRITNEGTTSANCVIHSVYLYNLLSQLDFKTGTNNKIVPDWLWSCSLKTKQEFLLGFADADGCDLEKSKQQVCGINQKLLKDFREISLSVGFSTTNIWKSQKREDCNPVFTFSFCPESRDYKKINEDYAIEKVRSITELEKEEVYDIQVDSELSNFVADGIVVHNSMIEPARRIWKQLSLIEDAMLIHRVMRAPQKRIFKVDVGNISPNEVDNHMKKYINGVKKTPYMDERTGDYNLKFNLQNMTEDYFLPVRGGDSGTEITDLAGMQWDGIDDVNYIKNKMFAALKVPKAFLNFDEGTSGKATLSAEDLRFARTISRIQKIIVSELKKIAMIHLYTQGYKDEELVNFELSLTNPSTIFEQEKISIWSEKVNLAKDMMENKLFSKKWIYQNVFNLSGDDIESERDSIVDDLKQSYRAKQIEEEGNDPAVSSGDTGGEDTTGSEDMPSDLPGDMGGDTGGDTGGGEASADSGGMPDLPPLEEMVNLVEDDKEIPTEEDFKKWGKEGGLTGGGRPKGNQHRFNTKNHPLGADWNGHKENKKPLNFDGSVRKRTTIDSMEKQLNELDKFINSIDKTLLKEDKK
jgi:hypothetical protein